MITKSTHQWRGSPMANPTAVVEPNLEDATALERGCAPKVIGRTEKTDIAQAQFPIAGRLLDRGVVQMHQLQGRPDCEVRSQSRRLRASVDKEVIGHLRSEEPSGGKGKCALHGAARGVVTDRT